MTQKLISPAFVHHSAGHFRSPVIDSRENGEHIGADQHIMNVRDDPVGIVDLPVQRDYGREYSTQPADHEQGDESTTKCMAAVITGRPIHMVATQAKTCTMVKIEIVMLAALKKLIEIRTIPMVNIW